MSTFAKALTYYLAVKGKTQQDLINDLHYSSSTVSQWCTGKNTPRMDRIEAVANLSRDRCYGSPKRSRDFLTGKVFY